MQDLFLTNPQKCKLAPVYLELLKGFIKHGSPDNYLNNEHWNFVWSELFGESLQKVFNRLIQNGYLVPSSLEDTLDFVFTLPQLKEFAKKLGGPVSGKKLDLIQRLIDCDKSFLENQVKKISIYSCSDSCKPIVEKYIQEKKEAYKKCEEQLINALKNKDFELAASTVIDYEKEQIFQRGMGIDWNKKSPVKFQNTLNLIFISKPGIIKDIEETEMEPLRVAAGMMYLQGKKWSNAWLPENFILHHKFDAETASRMLLFYSTHKENLMQYKTSSVIKEVEICSAYDSCDECKKLNGKKFTLEHAPELPYEKCTSEMGCRCTFIPVVEGQ